MPDNPTGRCPTGNLADPPEWSSKSDRARVARSIGEENDADSEVNLGGSMLAQGRAFGGMRDASRATDADPTSSGMRTRGEPLVVAAHYTSPTTPKNQGFGGVAGSE